MTILVCFAGGRIEKYEGVRSITSRQYQSIEVSFEGVSALNVELADEVIKIEVFP